MSKCPRHAWYLRSVSELVSSIFPFPFDAPLMFPCDGQTPRVLNLCCGARTRDYFPNAKRTFSKYAETAEKRNNARAATSLQRSYFGPAEEQRIHENENGELFQSFPPFVHPRSLGLSTTFNHHQLACVLTLIIRLNKEHSENTPR